MGPADEPILPAIASNSDSIESPLVTARIAVAGCVAAVAVASLLSLLPVKAIVSSIGILPAALFYIAQVVFAGALGALLFGAPAEDRSWRRLLATVLVLGPAWVWVAPAVLLNYHESDWALLVSAAGAAVLAIGIRPFAHDGATAEETRLLPTTREPFTGPIQAPPWDWHGLAIAVFGAAAFAALELDANSLGCGLAIACAFLFAWQWAGAIRQHLPWRMARERESRRLLRASIPAAIVTMLVLITATRHGAGGSGGTVNAAHRAVPENGTRASSARSPGAGFEGYRSIILWPEPPKKEIVAPVPLASLLPATQMKKPLIIRFTGAYWYFQPPETAPGSRAHLAHGSPLDANIHSTDFLPITMEAHQNLAAPIRLSRLREVDVVVENRDNQPGNIAIGMALSNSSAPRTPPVYLGALPLPSTEAGQFSQKSAPVEETLHFLVPPGYALRKFDELTLNVLPETSRMQLGARIAIEEFDLLPR